MSEDTFRMGADFEPQEAVVVGWPRLIEPVKGVFAEGTVHEIVRNLIGHVDKSVAALTFDKMVPSQENAASGAYTLTRLLYMNTKGEPTGLTALFVDYIYSEDGKAFISGSGYIPLERKR